MFNEGMIPGMDPEEVLQMNILKSFDSIRKYIDTKYSTSNSKSSRQCSDNEVLKQYYLIGKLLERCYINSTDIEYS